MFRFEVPIDVLSMLPPDGSVPYSKTEAMVSYFFHRSVGIAPKCPFPELWSWAPEEVEIAVQTWGELYEIMHPLKDRSLTA